MIITTNKTKISFLELKLLHKGLFVKILDPLVLAFKFIKIQHSGEQRLIFFLFPLWEEYNYNNPLSFTDNPIICINGFENVFFISKDFNEVSFFCNKEVFGKSQINLPLRGDIKLTTLYLLFDLQIYNLSPKGNKSKSYLYAKLLENKLLLANYLGDNKTAIKTLEIIKNTNFDIEHFNLWGVDFDLWLKKIEIKSTNEFRKKMKKNINERRKSEKLIKISSSKILFN